MRHEDPRNGGNERRVVGDGDVDVRKGAQRTLERRRGVSLQHELEDASEQARGPRVVDDTLTVE